MLDTNVFNDLLDGKIDVACLKGRRLIATHIQRDEISNTGNEVRRAELLSIYEFLTEEQVGDQVAVKGISVAGASSAMSVVSTESAVWDVSRWGQAKWAVSDGMFDGMRGELDALNKRKGNNTQDILIAETSLRNGWVLITSDRDLFAVVTKYGGACGNVFTLQAV